MTNWDDPAGNESARQNSKAARQQVRAEMRRDMARFLREHWGPIVIGIVVMGLLIADSIHGPWDLGCGIHIDSRPTEQAP